VIRIDRQLNDQASAASTASTSVLSNLFDTCSAPINQVRMDPAKKKNPAVHIQQNMHPQQHLP